MSFVILLLYLFCVFIRPQDWVPGLEGLPLVNGLTAATIFFILFEKAGNRKKGGFINVPQNKLMLGLFFAIIMSHAAHTYISGITEAFSAFSVIFILFFMTLNGIDSDRKFKIAVWFIVFLVFALVFQGMYQMENGYGWAGQNITIDFGLIQRINWIGIFNDPNDLALIFVVAVGIIIAFLFGRSSFIQKVILIPMAGYLCYGIFLTNSRGGLLALITTIIFYFIKRTKKFALGGIIGGIFALVIIVLGPSRLGLISVDENSAYGRVSLWYEGILLMKRSPIFGMGYDMFEDELPQTAHNSYILAGAELGIFGLFFWMALIYSSFKGLSAVQGTDDRLKQYAYGLQASLIGFCAAAFFLSRTYVVIPYLLFALSGSLMHIVEQRVPGLDFRFTRKDAKNVILLSLGVILAAYITVKIGI